MTIQLVRGGRLLDLLGASNWNMSYLLRDTFTTDRAAGSVNGTAAEPGPGTRTVVDTENKLSISGGKLVCAGGKASPSLDDPSIAYGYTSRSAGKTLRADIVTSSGQCRLGWASTSVAATKDAVYFVSTVLVAQDGGVEVVVGSFSYGAQVWIAIVLRAAGAFMFIKGSAYGAWTLLWHGLLETTASLRCVLLNYSGVFTADNLRIPTRLWLPTPLAYDTFTRADGALGSSEATGPDAQVTPQVAWTGATWAVSSNKAVNTTGSAFATQSHSTTNIIADITLAAYSTGVAGLVARVDSAGSPQNYVRAYQDAGNVKIDAVVSGTPANLGTYASAYATGDTLRLSLDSTAWRLYKITSAGVATLLGSGTTTVTTGTLHGMFSTDAGNQLDNWTCWARGNEGQYEELTSL